MLLLPLGTGSMVSLRLLSGRGSLLLGLGCLLRLRRILTSCLRRLRMVSVRRSCIRPGMRVLFPYIAILLTTLTIWRLRLQRGRRDIASGWLAEGLSIVLR